MLTKQIIPRLDLEKILANFSLGKIISKKALATSGNITCILNTSTGIYFLRLCPNGQRWRSQAEAAGEIELLNYLKSRNLPVIEALPTKNGRTVISWKKHFGYLRKYTAGRAKLKPTPDNFFAFGRTLGKMQAVLENYQTKNKRLHVFDLTATKKYFRAQKNNILKSNFLNKRPFVAALEKELFSLKFPATLPKGMIHEDLGRRHVLWQKDRIDAIIDFDRSYFGYLLFDLGQAGRAWGFKNNWHSFDRVGLARLLRGYQTERKLTKLEKELLPDAIKFAILERALSFCTRYLNFSKDPKDQAFAWNSVFKQLPLIDKNRGFIIETLK